MPADPLGELFELVLSEYEGRSRESTPYLAYTKEIPERLSGKLNVGYDEIATSKGRGRLPNIPVIALLDHDVTTTMRRGLYVAYLFDTDNEVVYLALTQGTGIEQSNLGTRVATRSIFEDRRAELASLLTNQGVGSDSLRIKQPPLPPSSLRTSTNALYDAATVAYYSYHVENLPSEQILIQDTERLYEYYWDIVSEGRYIDVVYNSPVAYDLWAEPRPTKPPGSQWNRYAEIEEWTDRYVRFSIYDVAPDRSASNLDVTSQYRGKVYAETAEMKPEWRTVPLFELTDTRSAEISATDETQEHALGLDPVNDLPSYLASQ